MYIRIPYGCKVYTVRLLVCLFVRFCFCILNPVRYFCSTLFSPYGLHFLQHTVRDNIPLSPTRGGGCSPSASTPRPPTTACARTSDHSLTISNLPPPRYVNYVLQYRTGFLHVIPYRFEISFSTSLTTVRDTFPILSFPLSNTVRYFQPNRSGLLLAIPYGLPTGIARLVPYGILF